MPGFGFGHGFGSATTRRRPSAPSAVPVAGDPISLSINDSTLLDFDGTYGVPAGGWTANVVLKDLPTGGTVDGSKLTLTVRDPGYDSSGNPTTVDRVIVGHAVLRRQYPNNTQRMIAASGSDVRQPRILRNERVSGTDATGGIPL